MGLISLCLILSSLFSCDSVLASSGNGSSGIGTAFIAKGLGARNLKSQVVRRGSMVMDLNTGETLLKVSEISRQDIPKNLVQARLGQAKGWESLPQLGSAEKGYWIVCTKEKCFKLLPISSSNKLIPSIMGSLQVE